jgi:hypothetical protein
MGKQIHVMFASDPSFLEFPMLRNGFLLKFNRPTRGLIIMQN